MVIKRVLIVFGVIIVISLLFAAYQVFLAPTDNSAPPTGKNIPAKSRWDGAKTQIYNTEFVRGNKTSVGLNQIAFRGLNRTATDVIVDLSIDGRSSWARDGTFIVRDDRQNLYLPQLQKTSAGATINFRLLLKRLPTNKIGPLYCNKKPAGTLDLLIFSPDGLFTVGLLSPAPPKSHCLGEKAGRKPLKGRPMTVQLRKRIQAAIAKSQRVR